MLILTGYLMLKNYSARGKGLEEDWKFENSRCKLLYRMDKHILLDKHPILNRELYSVSCNKTIMENNTKTNIHTHN